MVEAVAMAKDMGAQPGHFVVGQFDNPANPAIHRATTGPEIWRDTAGTVAALVAVRAGRGREGRDAHGRGMVGMAGETAQSIARSFGEQASQSINQSVF